MANGEAGEPYDAYYFAHSCGRPYQRDDEWLRFFQSVADHILSEYQPTSVLDAGCAMGFLVEALRKAGVEAYGVDVSSYAIENVHPDIRPYCWVGSVLDPLPRRYDLIVCIEVLEHLSQRDAERALENFCSHTDQVLLSSTAVDYKEASHFNVHPPEYWAEQFARRGFFRDVDLDASFITPWAAGFRKANWPVHRIVRDLERIYWLARKENADLRELAIADRHELAAKDDALSAMSAERDQALETLTSVAAERDRALETPTSVAAERDQALETLTSVAAERDQALETLTSVAAERDQAIKASSVMRADRERAVAALVTMKADVERLTAQVAGLEARWQDVESGVGWRLLERVRRPLLIFAPRGSTRHRWLMSLAGKRVKPAAEDGGIAGSGDGTPRHISGAVEDLPVRFRSAIRNWRSHGVRSLLRRPPEALAGQRSPGLIVPTAPTTDRYVRNLAGVVDERFQALRPLRAFRTPHAGPRLNVVTDSINSGSLFGGVATSLILSALLAERWRCDLRIITRTEEAVKRNFHDIMELNRIPWHKNVEFILADVSNPRAEIPVGDQDVFLTTSWWTTWSTRETFGEENIIYLLQEDERHFYPFGDDYLRCTELLKSPRLQFVVNTKLLHDHLASEGFDNIREKGLWFEPSFPAELFFYEGAERGEKKNFFFYARPNNPRNLFYLGLEVIRAAVARGILEPDEWEFYFVGKDIPAVRIADTCSPQLVENVGWAEYASLVRKMDLGLCLMHSPHPSYPPLDLASSGAVVVTNRYGKKQGLEEYSRNILCRDLDRDCLVKGIEDGAKLALDLETRVGNFRENGILRDWKISFEEVLVRLGTRGFDVSS